MKKIIILILTISLILGTGAFLVNAENVSEENSNISANAESQESTDSVSGGIKVNPDEYYMYSITLFVYEPLDVSQYTDANNPFDFYGITLDHIEVGTQDYQHSVFGYILTLNEQCGITPAEARDILKSNESLPEIWSINIPLPLEFNSGDINGDGKLTAADYLKMKKAIFGTYTFTHEELGRADVTYDNLVTAADYLKLKWFIFNGYDPYTMLE